jgi:ERCC4-type nuclease
MQKVHYPSMEILIGTTGDQPMLLLVLEREFTGRRGVSENNFYNHQRNINCIMWAGLRLIHTSNFTVISRAIFSLSQM